MVTLEELIKKHSDPSLDNFTNEFKLVARVTDGVPYIYIYPFGKDGDTIDFRVVNNALEPCRQ